MKKIFFLIAFMIISQNTFSLAAQNDCTEFKKFSVEYLKCKGKTIKEKAISTGQNIIKDTKDYQNKEWSEEKDKLLKTKEKIDKTKEKILN
tara:strand:+ start:60 stop:332 length:273 start_codon:yes stop_codon:yes gene_type:complete